MKRILTVLALCTQVALPAQAEQTPVVVELFTSQGCSSCPPADEMMKLLAARDDVIALSLHVDYWDYIGWKDEFAQPMYADRQRGYASVAGRRSIYTPEMIVNGSSDIVGAKPMELAMAIEKHKAGSETVALAVSRAADNRITIEARPLHDGLDAMDVQLVQYEPLRVSEITRGENAGKTIEYVNVTVEWQYLSKWDGRDALAMEVAAPHDLPVVILVQKIDFGPIVAAAKVQ